MTAARRHPIWALIIPTLLLACGGGGPTTPTATPSTAGEPTLPTNAAQSTAPPAAESGARLRVLNLSLTDGEPGPSVELRTTGTTAQTLLTVAPGELSDYVSIPKAAFGDLPANITIVDAGAAPGEFGAAPDLAAGDVVTSIVYRQESGGEAFVSVDSVWEKGEQGSGLPWPEVDPSSATLAIYSGPLVAAGKTIIVRDQDGGCLIEPDFNEPQDNGFAGTGATYLLLPPATTALLFSTNTGSECGAKPDKSVSVTIDVDPGDRIGVAVWIPQSPLELIAMDFGPAAP